MRLGLSVLIAVMVGLAPSAFAAEAADCEDAPWVSFSPQTPFSPEVADVAAIVWLPNLFFPCPSLFLAVGEASLQGPLAVDRHAGRVALAHTAFIFCCAPTLAASIVGLPIAMLETLWVAPVSTLNALDRDVRCGKARAPKVRPPTTTSSPPPTTTPPPPASQGDVQPTPRAHDPLPPPPPAPGSSGQRDRAQAPPMAF